MHRTQYVGAGHGVIRAVEGRAAPRTMRAGAGHPHTGWAGTQRAEPSDTAAV